jgi:hypothetical protein
MKHVPGIEAKIPFPQVRSEFVSLVDGNQAEATDTIAVEELVDAIPSEPIQTVTSHGATGLACASRRIDEINVGFGQRLQALLKLRAEITSPAMSLESAEPSKTADLRYWRVDEVEVVFAAYRDNYTLAEHPEMGRVAPSPAA